MASKGWRRIQRSLKRCCGAAVVVATLAGGCGSADDSTPAPTTTVGEAPAPDSVTSEPPSSNPSAPGDDLPAIDDPDLAAAARDVLAGMGLSPRAPTLLSLSRFGREDTLYGDAAVAPPDDSPHDEDTERERLIAFMAGDDANLDEALRVFDDSRVHAIVPDPRLRAALAGSVGTIWQPMIEHLLDPENQFTGIDYGAVRFETAVASSEGEGFGSGPRKLTVNERFIGERFELLIPTIGHEVLHDDGTGQLAEEIVANLFSAAAHGQVLLRRPELALGGSTVARGNNALLAALLLSRDDAGDVRLRVDAGDPLFSDATDAFREADDFVELLEVVYGYRNLGVSVVSEQLEPRLQDMLGDVLSPGTSIPSGRDLRITDDLIEFVDANLDLSSAGLDPVAQIRLALLLELIDPSAVEELERAYRIDLGLLADP